MLLLSFTHLLLLITLLAFRLQDGLLLLGLPSRIKTGGQGLTYEAPLKRCSVEKQSYDKKKPHEFTPNTNVNKESENDEAVLLNAKEVQETHEVVLPNTKEVPETNKVILSNTKKVLETNEIASYHLAQPLVANSSQNVINLYLCICVFIFPFF